MHDELIATKLKIAAFLSLLKISAQKNQVLVYADIFHQIELNYFMAHHAYASESTFFRMEDAFSIFLNAE